MLITKYKKMGFTLLWRKPYKASQQRAGYVIRLPFETAEGPKAYYEFMNNAGEILLVPKENIE